MHETKLQFVSRIEFVHSKLSNFSAQASGVSDTALSGTVDQTARGVQSSELGLFIQSQFKHACVTSLAITGRPMDKLSVSVARPFELLQNQ